VHSEMLSSFLCKVYLQGLHLKIESGKLFKTEATEVKLVGKIPNCTKIQWKLCVV